MWWDGGDICLSFAIPGSCFIISGKDAPPKLPNPLRIRLLTLLLTFWMTDISLIWKNRKRTRRVSITDNDNNFCRTLWLGGVYQMLVPNKTRHCGRGFESGQGDWGNVTNFGHSPFVGVYRSETDWAKTDGNRFPVCAAESRPNLLRCWRSTTGVFLTTFFALSWTSRSSTCVCPYVPIRCIEKKEKKQMAVNINVHLCRCPR